MPGSPTLCLFSLAISTPGARWGHRVGCGSEQVWGVEALLDLRSWPVGNLRPRLPSPPTREESTCLPSPPPAIFPSRSPVMSMRLRPLPLQPELISRPTYKRPLCEDTGETRPASDSDR